MHSLETSIICDGTMYFACEAMQCAINSAEQYGCENNAVAEIRSRSLKTDFVESPDKNKPWLTCKFTAVVEFDLVNNESKTT